MYHWEEFFPTSPLVCSVAEVLRLLFAPQSSFSVEKQGLYFDHYIVSADMQSFTASCGTDPMLQWFPDSLGGPTFPKSFSLQPRIVDGDYCAGLSDDSRL